MLEYMSEFLDLEASDPDIQSVINLITMFSYQKTQIQKSLSP